jgi:hypothetical protein
MKICGGIKHRTLFLLIIALLLIIHGCIIKQKNNTLTGIEKKEGWILLFDGKTLNSWRGLGSEQVPEGQWIIEDESIKKIARSEGPRQEDGQPILGGDLITIETFENFELICDWKLKENGNSGIKYNVSEELSLSWPPLNAALGWEYQMVDDDIPGIQDSPDKSSGALYDMIAPSNKVLKPIGEFNSSRIIVNGNHCEHWLNGKKVLEYEMNSARFDSLFQHSKYKDIPGFANKKNGHIALQDHAEVSWFRNIKIRRLDAGYKE